MIFKSITLIIVSYFIGAIPVSYILCKRLKKIDLRTVGSRNVGATNAARILGKKWFFIITIMDCLKGFLPVYLSKNILCMNSYVTVIVALSSILGHTYPVYLKFKGGKGVAVSAGVLLAMDYRLVLIGLFVFIIVTGLTKFVSAGSVLASASIPISYCFLNRRDIDPLFLGFVIIIACYVIFKHRENINRILKGTERKWGQRI